MFYFAAHNSFTQKKLKADTVFSVWNQWNIVFQLQNCKNLRSINTSFLLNFNFVSDFCIFFAKSFQNTLKSLKYILLLFFYFFFYHNYESKLMNSFSHENTCWKHHSSIKPEEEVVIWFQNKTLFFWDLISGNNQLKIYHLCYLPKISESDKQACFSWEKENNRHKTKYDDTIRNQFFLYPKQRQDIC